MPNNMMLLYNPLSDSGGFSGGGWQSGLPLSNLADQKLYRMARSIDTDPAHTQFRVALNTMATFKAIVLGGALKDQGMAPFGRFLNETDVEDVRAYLLWRAKTDDSAKELATGHAQ